MRKILIGERTNLTALPHAISKIPYTYQENNQPLLRSEPHEKGVSNQQVEEFITALAEAPGLNVHTTMIVKDGSVISEAGFNPYDLSVWHITHSLCKTIISLAIGMAIDEGKLELQQHITDFFPERLSLLTSKRTRQLTIEHLLMMKSGVSFNEAGVIISTDWIKDYLNSDFLFEPGTDFNYNSMNTFMLATILTQVTKMSVLEYLQPRLLDPLGISNIMWEKNNQGIEKGGWGMYITTEDLAKIGQLILQEGTWHGNESQQLVPQHWIEAMLTTHTKTVKQREDYGYQIWISKERDYFCMTGLFGQIVYINPEHQLVVVVLANNKYVLNNRVAVELIHKHLLSQPDSKTLEQDTSLTSLQQFEHTITYQHIKLAQPSIHKVLMQTNDNKSFWQKIMEKFGAKQEEVMTEDKIDYSIPEELAHKLPVTAICEKNQAGLMPFIMQMANSNYVETTEEIRLENQDDVLYMIWKEKNDTYTIPIGIYQSFESNIVVHGEDFKIASFCQIATDEDDHLVLKIHICFLEQSSTRSLKIYFKDEHNQLVLHLDEDPDFSEIMGEALQGMNMNNMLGSFLTDSGYLDFTVRRLTTPIIIANMQEESTAQEN